MDSDTWSDVPDPNGPPGAAADIPAGPAPTREFDPELAAAVNAALVGELDEGLAVDPNSSFGDERRLFAALYVRHRFGIGQHAWRYLHDRRDVDEVVQETFLRLFLALPDLDSEAQAVAWCRRTATNLCIDRYRAAQRRPSMVDLDHVVHELVVDDEPSDPLVQAEDAAVVRHALSLLSPLHREALVKREIEEKSIPQIAAEMAIPEESVKHVLYRARRALRRLLVDTSVAPGRGTALLLVIAIVLSLPSVLVPALRRVGGRGGPSVTVGSGPRASASLSPVPATVGPVPVPPQAPAAAAVGAVAVPPVAVPPVAHLHRPASATVRPPVVRTSPPRASHPAPAASDSAAAVLSPGAPSRAAAPVPAPPLASPARVAVPASPLQPAGGATARANEPRFTLSGMPVISNEAVVEQQALSLDANGAVSARSTFVAQTLDVDLTLNQSVRRNADQSIDFFVDAEFTEFGQAMAISTTATSTDVTAVANDDGTVTVSVVAILHSVLPTDRLRPFGTDGPTPIVEPAFVPTVVSIVAVYRGDLTELLRETVRAS